MDIKWTISKGIRYLFNPSALKNCQIDELANVGKGCDLKNVKIGKHSYIGHWSFALNTEIGKFCSLGQRCCIGGGSHPMQYVSTSPAFVKVLNGTRYKYTELECIPTPKTVIENDVWFGTGVYVKSGCHIHTGAVIGMHSVVTKDVGPYEIWAGNPARKIKDRFDDDIKTRLLESQWWEYEDEKLFELAPYFNDPINFLEKISDQ